MTKKKEVLDMLSQNEMLRKLRCCGTCNGEVD